MWLDKNIMQQLLKETSPRHKSSISYNFLLIVCVYVGGGGNEEKRNKI